MNILTSLDTLLARRLAGLASLLVAGAIAILSILPGENLPDVHLSDKVEHAIAYAVLSACICFWLGRRRIIAGVLVTVGFGALLEIAQALAGTGRTASLLDEGANLVGACLGACLAWMVAKAARAG
jgi:VanZ family protein